MATCNLCGERFATDCEEMADEIPQMLDHLRVMHPDKYGDGPVRWPDGGIVLDDSDVVEPSDFTDEGGTP